MASDQRNIIHVDGSVGGKRFHGGCGAYLMKTDGTVVERSRYLGDHITVEVAETEGVLLGLEVMAEIGKQEPFTMYIDNEQVRFDLLNGGGRRKGHITGDYARTVARARDILPTFTNLELKHVSGEDNKAHFLAIGVTRMQRHLHGGFDNAAVTKSFIKKALHLPVKGFRVAREIGRHMKIGKRNRERGYRIRRREQERKNHGRDD